MAERIMPYPVWNFSVAGDEVMHRGLIWNRLTEESRILAEDAAGSRFFADGRKALILYGETANVVDVASGEIISTLEFPSSISGVAFLPLEKRIMTGHDNGELRLVDLESCQHIQLGRVHDNCEAKIATHACKRILLTTTGKKTGGGKPADHQVAIWTLSEGLESKPLEQIQSRFEDSEQRRSMVRAAILDEIRDVPAVQE